MASDDNNAKKESVSEMEKLMTSVQKIEKDLTDELKKHIEKVDTDMVSLATSIDQLHEKVMNISQDVVKAIPSTNSDNELGVKEFVAKTHAENMSQQVKSVSVGTESAKSIDQFHQDAEKAIPSTNSGNEMDDKEFVAKTPEHTSQLVKSVKNIKSMQTNMIQSLSKLLHFLYVDSEEICTNKLPDKCKLQIDTYFLLDKGASETEDVWIKMLQEENKRLRERNKLYRERAALVNTREKLVSEDRDRMRNELNALYQNAGSHVSSDGKLVYVNNHFADDVKNYMQSAHHHEKNAEDLSSAAYLKEGVQSTDTKETSAKDLSLAKNDNKDVHVTGNEEKNAEDLPLTKNDNKDVHGTGNEEENAEDLSLTKNDNKDVHGTGNEEKNAEDLSLAKNDNKDVHVTGNEEKNAEDLLFKDNEKNYEHGIGNKEKTTEHLSPTDSIRKDVHRKPYNETDIDDVMEVNTILELKNLLDEAKQQNDKLAASLQQTNQSLVENEKLLESVLLQPRYEVDVMFTRNDKYVFEENYLLSLLTQNNIECNVVENFAISGDVNRVALILCLGTTKKSWDEVIKTSKSIFPENRNVAFVMMYSTKYTTFKENCEEAQKKHVEFLSNRSTEVFSIRFYDSSQEPIVVIYPNEQNALVEYIRDHSSLETKVVGCRMCTDKA